MTTFFYVSVVLLLFVDLDQIGNFQLFNEHIVVHHLCSVLEICRQAGLLFSYNDYVVKTNMDISKCTLILFSPVRHLH